MSNEIMQWTLPEVLRQPRWYQSLALSLMLLAIWVKPAHADLLSRGFDITYEVSRNDMYLGDSSRQYRQQPNGEWVYQSTTQAKGLAGLFFHDTIVETSILKQLDSGVIPLSYVYQQTGGSDTKQYRIRFLWPERKIYNSHLKKYFNIEAHTQDAQTFLLQIMHDLHAHQNTMTYYIASRGDTTTYVLTQNGNTKIETPYKTLDTIELVSNKRKDTDQYRVWCAVGMDFMPVRVEKIDTDGNKIVFAIKDFKPR